VVRLTKRARERLEVRFGSHKSPHGSETRIEAQSNTQRNTDDSGPVPVGHEGKSRMRRIRPDQATDET
jgi:hypothetical protein